MADITKKQAYELEKSVRDITEMPETKVSIITGRYYPKTVSYTHLTLPTSDLV